MLYAAPIVVLVLVLVLVLVSPVLPLPAALAVVEDSAFLETSWAKLKIASVRDYKKLAVSTFVPFSACNTATLLHSATHTAPTMSASLIKSAKSIIPTLDRVLVQRIKVPQQTSSGIYIPEKNQPKNNLATVIAVGPGFTAQNGELIKPSVQSGDKVLIPPHGGTAINVEKEEYLLMRDAEILAKIQE